MERSINSSSFFTNQTSQDFNLATSSIPKYFQQDLEQILIMVFVEIGDYAIARIQGLTIAEIPISIAHVLLFIVRTSFFFFFFFIINQLNSSNHTFY